MGALQIVFQLDVLVCWCALSCLMPTFAKIHGAFRRSMRHSHARPNSLLWSLNGFCGTPQFFFQIDFRVYCCALSCLTPMFAKIHGVLQLSVQHGPLTLFYHSMQLLTNDVASDDVMCGVFWGVVLWCPWMKCHTNNCTPESRPNPSSKDADN